jgi:hypothetical protein
MSKKNNKHILDKQSICTFKPSGMFLMLTDVTTYGLLLHVGLFMHPLNCVMLSCTLLLHCKKVRDFPVPSRNVTNQTLPPPHVW